MRKRIQNFRDNFLYYKSVAEKALVQVPDDALNRVVAYEGNSVAMIVRHISGNLVSRFTDFLSSDGEKPWRHRDSEFENRQYSREEMNALWEKGWAVLTRELDSLSDEDLANIVTIRSEAVTVHQALLRALAHVSHHVGQIVLLARMFAAAEWKWISVPKGMSEQFNQKMAAPKKTSPA